MPREWGARGSAVGTAKLTEKEVVEIKKAIRSGKPLLVIAQQFGIGRSTVYEIKAGRRWRHVTIPEDKVIHDS